MKSANSKRFILKIVIIVIVVCGVTNTYIMAYLWYMRGWNPAYVGFGLLSMAVVAFAGTQWPEKYQVIHEHLPYTPDLDDIPDPEYIEEDDRFNPDQHI